MAGAGHRIQAVGGGAAWKLHGGTKAASGSKTEGPTGSTFIYVVSVYWAPSVYQGLFKALAIQQ